MPICLRPYISTAFLVFFALFSAISQAEVHTSDSRIWRRARPISAGQQLWSMQSSFRTISKRFSSLGSVQPVGARYARTTTWRDLIDNETEPTVRAALNDYVRTNNIGLDDVAAISEYKVQREETVMQFDWAYGLTSTWTIGVELPFIFSNTKVSNTVSLTPNLRRASTSVQSKISSGGINEKVEKSAERQLANSGYDEIPDQEQKFEWGDINLVNQFSLYKSLRWMWSLQQNVRFPTSRNLSAYEYIQLSRDEGQVDLGVTNLLDFRYSRWTVGTKLGYVVQTQDVVKIKTPATAGKDQKVTRDLGDWYSAGTDVDYRLAGRWNFAMGYSYLAKAKDKYVGSGALALGENTNQTLHMAQVGFDYLVDSEGSRQGVEDKWQLSFNYAKPLMGQNAIEDGKASLELTGYF